MRKRYAPTGHAEASGQRPNGRNGRNGHIDGLDAGLVAANVAHELANAVFALRLNMPRDDDAIRAVLDRIEELARGLRLVAETRGSARSEGEPSRQAWTHLPAWWDHARMLLLVSTPKGVHVSVDFPPDLPPVRAAESEIATMVLSLARRVVGGDVAKGPRTLRLIARREGGWVRLIAISHGFSREFAADPAGSVGRGEALSGPGGDAEALAGFIRDLVPERSASVLVAAADERGE